MNDGVLGIVGSLFSLAGSFLFLSAAIGLLRLPDFYTRAHAPTKAATLGLLLAAFGSILLFSGRSGGVWLEEVLLVLFVLITVPISTQMLVRGAAARGVPQSDRCRGEPINEPIERLDQE